MLSFDALLALAKSPGFKGSKQIKCAVRRDRGTAFAMEMAQALAALVTDAELQRELASLSFWDGVCSSCYLDFLHLVCRGRSGTAFTYVFVRIS